MFDEVSKDDQIKNCDSNGESNENNEVFEVVEIE